jgi:transcriptional regulator with XRE-family HTH domain
MPPPPKHPRVLRTLGDHLKKARLERGLFQVTVAGALGVSVTTVNKWERNHTQVATRSLPKLLAFLGYDPRLEGGHLGERIRMLRERQGLSQEALAAKLGLSPLTVNRWERGRVRKPVPEVRRRFEEFLAGGSASISNGP